MAAGSATRAARALQVSQPAVSQLIAQMERQAGFALFTRHSGRLTPTWEAHALFAEVDKAFLGVDRVERVVAGLRDKNWGTINLASFPGMVGRLLPSILSAYWRKHPEIEIGLEVRRSRDLPEMVVMRQVDLAITLLPSERQDIISSLIGSVEAVCIVPTGHRLAKVPVIHASDLEDENFVSLGRHDRWRHAIDAVFADLQIGRRMRIETAQTEAACSFVANGCGVAVVDPISLFNVESAAFVARPFEPAVWFELWLLRPTLTAQSKLVDDLARFIRRDLRRTLRTRSRSA
jgi:DNA-binding transcriptional LysR family regulator